MSIKNILLSIYSVFLLLVFFMANAVADSNLSTTHQETDASITIKNPKVKNQNVPMKTNTKHNSTQSGNVNTKINQDGSTTHTSTDATLNTNAP